MKYLKYFESLVMSSILEDLKDISLDFIDKGMEMDISSDTDRINISIYKKNDRFFLDRDLRIPVLRIYEYLRYHKGFYSNITLIMAPTVKKKIYIRSDNRIIDQNYCFIEEDWPSILKLEMVFYTKNE